MDVINNKEYEKMKFLKKNNSIPPSLKAEDIGLFRGVLKKKSDKNNFDYKITDIKFYIKNGEFGEIFKKYNDKNRNEELYLNNKFIKNYKNKLEENKKVLFEGYFKKESANIFIEDYRLIFEGEPEYNNLIEKYKQKVSNTEKDNSLNDETNKNTINNIEVSKVSNDSSNIKDYNEIEIDKYLKTEDFNKEIKEIDDKIDNLKDKNDEEHASINDTISKVNKNYDNIKTNVDEINKKIKNINFFKTCKNLKRLGNTNKNKSENKYIKDKKDMPSEKAIENISNWIYENKKVKYDNFTIKQFFAALHTNQILILSGKPGTGKTSLVESFSQAVGIEYKMISVQPNWYENQDVIGFYNPIEKIYNSTPVIDFLIEAENNPEKLYLLCFDEMNLAQTEYYLSEFLSKMETEKREIEFYSGKLYESNFSQSMETIRFIVKKYAKEDKEDECLNKDECLDKLSNEDEYLVNILNLIKKIKFEDIDFQAFDRFCKEKAKLENYFYYGNSIKIPENVRFVGTINKDETTKNISPKVIDRSLIMEVKALDSLENTTKKDSSKENKESKKCCLSAEYFKVRKDDKESEAFKIKMAKIKKDFKTILKIDLNGRFDKHVRELYNSGVFEIEEKKNDNLLDAIILMKIIPKINIYIDSDEKDEFKEKISPLFKEYNHSEEVYKDMEKYCDKNEVFTFWR